MRRSARRGRRLRTVPTANGATALLGACLRFDSRCDWLGPPTVQNMKTSGIVFGALALVLASAPLGCGRRTIVVENSATLATQPDFSGRLLAAQRIVSIAEKDDALVRIAKDAATAGNPEVATQALAGIVNLNTKDDAAYAASMELAKLGKSQKAVQIADMIVNITLKDKVLKKIAKGETQ